MIFRDQFRVAFGNLRKTRLRTVLTAAGVAIGIGAMTSMVSVGLGTQRNVLRAFNEQYILTSVLVRRPEASDEAEADSLPMLDSETIEALHALPGVRDAYPLLTIAGLLRMDEQRLFRSLEGMPARLLTEQIEHGRIELIAGRPYQEGELNRIVLSERAAQRLVSEGEELETLIGRSVSFVAAQAADTAAEEPTPPGTESQPPSPDAAEFSPGLQSLPVIGMLSGSPLGRYEPVRLELEIVGIVRGGGSLADFVGLSLWVPVEVVEPLYSRTFQDLASILSGEVAGTGYPMVQVLTSDILAVRPVQDTVQAMGFAAESILDQITQIRRAFMFMNSLLGTIGGVSLLVAGMMIVNTLVMAVLERTSEIGLLKSMGATDGDVMRLFLTEAGVIGVLGGMAGLILGWVVARITNAIANYQFERAGEVAVDLVAFSVPLILGGLAFALVVSLLAGYYPAHRAARVDPVVALRHF